MANKSLKINSFKAKTKIACLAVAFSLLIFSKPALADDITPSKVVELVNIAREQSSLPDLTVNAMLQSAAQKKAQDMVANNYFAHVSPQGKTPWDFISASGYDYRYAGENLAINFTTAKDQQQAWMNSELHRQNILNPDYKETGVAVVSGVIDGQKGIITVQEFGMQMPKAPQIANTENKILPQNKTVAGISMATGSKDINVVKQVRSEVQSSKTLLENNALTPLGWFAVLLIALFAVIIDLAKIIYEKQQKIIILHRAINKQI